MANTCSEDYVFYGVDNDAKSKAELEELRKLIQECKETKDAWIGNIALSAGLGQPPMNCRSSVIDVDEADPTGAFRVYLDSAWDSKFEFWCWLIPAGTDSLTYTPASWGYIFPKRKRIFCKSNGSCRTSTR